MSNVKKNKTKNSHTLCKKKSAEAAIQEKVLLVLNFMLNHEFRKKLMSFGAGKSLNYCMLFEGKGS